MATAKPRVNTMPCGVCKKSDKPLVPAMVPGERDLCSQCTHAKQVDRLKRLEKKYEEKKIIRESGEMEWQLEGKEPNRSDLQLAHSAVTLMMKLHVPKKSKEEVGKFEPTLGDVQLMEALAPDVCLRLRKGSLREFHSILHPVNHKVDGKIELTGTLFEVFDSKQTNTNEYRDQSKRAQTLVAEMKKHNSRKVFLLDGHGRTLLSIIHAMIEQGLNPDSYDFVVVDNDKECQCFHEHFFPESVTCKCMDILDIDLENTDMMYMNFCSIPSRVENIIFNKEEVLKWLWKKMGTMQCGIMVSAMIRDARTRPQKIEGTITAIGPRKGKSTREYHLLPGGFQEYLEAEGLFDAKIVSSRQNFKTWLLLPERCAVKDEQECLKEWLEGDGMIWDRNRELCPGALVKCTKSKGKQFRITHRTPDKVDLKEHNPQKHEDKLETFRSDIKNVSEIRSDEYSMSDEGIGSLSY